MNKPYYLETDLRKRWRSIILISIFIALLLLIFQPFGLNRIQNYKELKILGYGGISLLMISIYNIAGFKIFTSFFDERKWNTGRELLSILILTLLIGLANFVYTYFIGSAGWSFNNLIRLELYTFTLAIFPAFLLIFMTERRLSHKYTQDSKILNIQIDNIQENSQSDHPSKDDGPSKLQWIKIPSPKAEIEFKTSDFVFATAADNYCKIHFIDGAKLERKLIRISMKQLSTLFNDATEIMRCHKSYIVNLMHVESLSGNAQGYKLHLTNSDEIIPVSRSKNLEIKSKIKAFITD